MKTHDIKCKVRVVIRQIVFDTIPENLPVLRITWNRGDSNGTTMPIPLNKDVKEEFSFTSTFQYSKSVLKPKPLKLTYFTQNNPIATVSLNLSDYVILGNETRQLKEEYSSSFGDFHVHLDIIFGNGGHSSRLEKVGKQTILSQSANSSLSSSLSNSPTKSILSQSASSSCIPKRKVQISVQTARNKNSLDLSDFDFTKRQTSPSPYTIQQIQKEDQKPSHRHTGSCTDRSPDSSPSSKVVEISPPSSITPQRQQSFRTNQIQKFKVRENSSLRSTVEALSADEDAFVQDINRNSSFLEMEEKAKNTDNTILTHLIFNTLTTDKFTATSALSQVVLLQLNGYISSDILPLRLCIYLYSSISQILTLYTNIFSKQRVEGLGSFLDDLHKTMSKCHWRLMKLFEERLSTACVASFKSGCTEKPFLLEFNAVIKQIKEFRMYHPFQVVVVSDMFRLFNIVFAEEVTHGHCTLMNGFQIQMMLGMMSDFEFKMKEFLVEKDNLVIVKEIARVLVLSQKNLLEETRGDVCPHLTADTLVKILTNFNEMCPGEVPPGIISLLGRSDGAFKPEFFDFNMPELKEQRLKSVTRDALECKWTPFNITTTPFASRNYLNN
ncbi:hypothetical protein EIN_026470 [Entamoeba invadens IP1]|uniref:hypothetical protein n=1 Tax=Entamoeba invadens IP1 TaxID=370355 RepID=UPI0002C3DC15|nr:hypothetical protein EIN_026470 [Entamoeba invadens IP1]ELP90788.1 hypothetical protein EIN_026470 [Entamoeba invadens IP1]|eukprot:XP_004257559.1 hypothetical protein EIN_026470 [Entamoeba invadens IP1]